MLAAVASAGALSISGCGVAEEWHAEPFQTPGASSLAPPADSSSAAPISPDAESTPPTPTHRASPTEPQREPKPSKDSPLALSKNWAAKVDAAGTITHATTVTYRSPGKALVVTSGRGITSVNELGASRIVMDLNLAGRPRSVEFLITAKGTYYRLPPDLAKKIGSKRWVTWPTAHSMVGSGTSIAGDPSDGVLSCLELFEEAGLLRKLGTKSIRGVIATHYKGVLPPGPGTFGEPLKVEFWFGPDGTLLTARIVQATATGSTDTRVEFLELGATLDLRPPKASELTVLKAPPKF